VVQSGQLRRPRTRFIHVNHLSSELNNRCQNKCCWWMKFCEGVGIGMKKLSSSTCIVRETRQSNAEEHKLEKRKCNFLVEISECKQRMAVHVRRNPGRWCQGTFVSVPTIPVKCRERL
jgi:hypothetical protein